MNASIGKSLIAEMLGSALLLTIVVGSGIMGDQLSGGNIAIALLANSLATGAGLFVLIMLLGAVSGAHFNPAVSLVAVLRGELSSSRLGPYILAQCAGAVVGVWIAHTMFGMEILQVSDKLRTGASQWWAELIATFGLVLTILGSTSRRQPQAVVAGMVALYITAAYWFTASTSFANPAVTLARSMTDTFAGIRPDNVLGFVVSQGIGALAATVVARILFAEDPRR